MEVVGPAGAWASDLAGSNFSGLAFTGVSAVGVLPSIALAVVSVPPSLHDVKPTIRAATAIVVRVKRMLYVLICVAKIRVSLKKFYEPGSSP